MASKTGVSGSLLVFTPNCQLMFSVALSLLVDYVVSGHGKGHVKFICLDAATGEDG